MELTKKSLERLAVVHPDLVRVVKRCAQNWNNNAATFVVACGGRTYEEQIKAVKDGVSMTMHSRHLIAKNGYSHAVDLALIVNGKADYTPSKYTNLANAMKSAAASEKVPIEWGGDWNKFKDRPHFQLPWAKYPG